MRAGLLRAVALACVMCGASGAAYADKIVISNAAVELYTEVPKPKAKAGPKQKTRR